MSKRKRCEISVQSSIQNSSNAFIIGVSCVKRCSVLGALLAVSLALSIAPAQSFADDVDDSTQGIEFMHRLYNPWSGEHFYTSDDAEYENVVAEGWVDEGVGWTAPTTSNTPVYRVYNPYSGEHHYTTDAAERDSLISAGWVDEGIGWYSDDELTEPLYRQYNPNEYANNHNYTKDVEERDSLIAIGWKDEGVGWYGCSIESHAIKPETVNPNHKNIVDYKDDAVVIQGASYDIAEDGSVLIASSSLPGGLNPGDVVVFESVSNNQSGIAVKVDEDGAYDGSLSGGTPAISEVYDSIDVETVGIVLSDGFVPEPDVEVVNVAETPLDQTAPAETTVIYPQAMRSEQVMLQSANSQEDVFQAADSANLVSGAVASGIKVMAVEDGGSVTSKLTLKYKGLTFTIKPTGTIKCVYDLSGVSNLYVSVKFEESLSVAEELSSLIGTEPIAKKLGSVTFLTSVPGLSLEGSVWFAFDADGKLKLSLVASQELGIKYTRNKGCVPVNAYSCKPKLNFSAELETGIDFVGTVKMAMIKIVDPSLEARFTLGVDSSDATTRPNGMVCNDIKLGFAPSISVGSHEGLFKDLGIKFKMKLTELILKKWHMENGSIVRNCTWDGGSGVYESSPLLFESDDAVFDDVYRDVYAYSHY